MQDLGIIEYERPLYHTEKNFFPIGYKSLREHNSQLTLGHRCQYTCEILDGGPKPQFRVTPGDDPKNPIVRDSSTGCWVSEYCLNNYRLTSAKGLMSSKGTNAVQLRSAAQRDMALPTQT